MKSSKLTELMNETLPSLSFQKRRKYKTNIYEVRKIYKLINNEIFNDKLPMAKLIVKKRMDDAWGKCYGIKTPTLNKSGVELVFCQNWYCKQWLIMTIAHEMCHQYQWDIIGYQRLKKNLKPLISHGPTFYQHRKKLFKRGIPLKKYMYHMYWFQHQNILKC
jgi:hypothetical protein